MITLIAAAIATTLPTATAMPRSINLDGVRATYTRSVDADGTVHLRGRYHDKSVNTFHYRIRNNQVRGEVGAASVAFTASR